MHVDQTLSTALHDFHSTILDIILFPCSLPTNAKLMPLTILLYFHYTSFLHTARYALAVLFGLILTLLLKKIIGRQRPALRLEKVGFFRRLEHNCAMPSGDSCQGAILCLALWNAGVSGGWLVLYQIGVCMSRVYFMCHWISDTMVGSMIGMWVFVVQQYMSDMLINRW